MNKKKSYTYKEIITYFILDIQPIYESRLEFVTKIVNPSVYVLVL